MANNFVSVGSSHPATTNTGVARIDHAASNSLRLFATLVHYNNYTPSQPIFPGSVLDNAVGASETTGYESTAGVAKIWNPSLITEVRFGFFPEQRGDRAAQRRHRRQKHTGHRDFVREKPRRSSR